MPIQSTIAITFNMSEVDRSFILFSKKAEDALGSNYMLAGGDRAIAMDRSFKPKSDPPPSSSSSASFRERPGPPMQVEDIMESYTKLQKTKTQDVLHGIQRIGKLTWTEKGELYDVNSNSIMEGTDIQIRVCDASIILYSSISKYLVYESTCM